MMGVKAPALKRFLKRWSRRVFATAARSTAPARRRRLTPGLRILTYHRVVEDPQDPFAVSPQNFLRQMEILAATGAVAALDDSLGDLSLSSENLARVAISFDDGTIDFVTAAAPILSRLELSAIVYVNPSRVGTSGFMGWDDLRRFPEMGIRVGSHGLDHHSLGRLDAKDLRRQVRDSRSILEDRLGGEVTSLAYPFGTLLDFNEEVKQEVRRAGYRSGCTSVNGVNRTGVDPYELRRTKIEWGDQPIFDWILSGCLDAWAFIDRHLPALQNRYA